MARPADILVVDDSTASSNKLTEILEAQGYLVSVVTSAEEAIQRFNSNKFDVVISELMLPGMSGLNMMKIIKERSPETEVIIVSSNASSFNTVKALRQGAFDFIVKPIDDESVLYNVVEKVLEKQESGRIRQLHVNELTEKNKGLNESLAMMKIVNQICVLLTSTFDIANILQKLTETATEHLQATRGYLLLLDKSGSNLNVKVCTGIDIQSTANFKLAPGLGISGRAVSSGKPIIIADTSDEIFLAGIKEEDPEGVMLASPSILSVPLLVNGRVAGALTISGGCNGKPFTDDHLEFLSMLSRYASIAVENAGVVHKLKKQQ
ncbi:MAG: response regulator [Geobacteraceae bacterium]|nr:response regulator [Geobacteraceae bacterium]NTW79715.1 response regulator [Geobacteraceae bacterium]